MFLVESVMFGYVRHILFKRSTILRQLLSCMYCTGFWVGLIYSLLYYDIMFAAFQIQNSSFLSAFVISALIWFISIIESKLYVQP